jgi:beta-lactamase class A
MVCTRFLHFSLGRTLACYTFDTRKLPLSTATSPLNRGLGFGLLLLLLLNTTVSAAEPHQARDEIERHAASLDLMVGVSAVHLETGVRIELNESRHFPLASTYKVPMAAYALHLATQGTLALDQLIEVSQQDLVISSPITRLFPHPGIQLSLLNLLEATLIRSDNTATDVLLRTIGGGQAVTAWLQQKGIDGLRVDRPTADLIRDYMGMPSSGNGISMAQQYQALSFESFEAADWRQAYQRLLDDPRDQGTPRAMTRLLEGIWRDTLLTEPHGETLRTIMARCLTGSTRLSGRMPDQQLPLAHKTGTLGGTVNDVGVMLLPDGRGTVVVSVFSRGASALDVEKGERLISEVGRTVYDYFLFNADSGSD